VHAEGEEEIRHHHVDDQEWDEDQEPDLEGTAQLGGHESGDDDPEVAVSHRRSLGGGPELQRQRVKGRAITSIGVLEQKFAERFFGVVGGGEKRANRFDELTLAAAPRFLGLLRKSLSPQVTKLVVKQLDKDLIHESMGDLTTRFFREPLARS